MVKKYYIEITDERDHDASYIMQSQWFDTDTDAIAWYKTIDFLDNHYFASLMYALYDETENIYNDIIMEKFL
jgi:hypothetical protein